jgi:tetratricopeptide (TPR) repeat protein
MGNIEVGPVGGRARRRASWVVVLVSCLAACSPLVAQIRPEPVEPVGPPDPIELREGGRPALRAWIERRGGADRTRRDASVKEFAACLDLAAHLSNESAHDLLAEVLREADARIGGALSKSPRRQDQARQVANLGDAYERMLGDATQARRLYRQALALDAHDEVAQAGLARLDLAEAVDTQKEIEVERLKELEEWFAKQPRSRPDRRADADRGDVLETRPEPQP